MLTANQIAAFFKVYFLKKEVMNQADFLHVDIASKFPTSSYYYLYGMHHQIYPKFLK